MTVDSRNILNLKHKDMLGGFGCVFYKQIDIDRGALLAAYELSLFSSI